MWLESKTYVPFDPFDLYGSTQIDIKVNFSILSTWYNQQMNRIELETRRLFELFELFIDTNYMFDLQHTSN